MDDRTAWGACGEPPDFFFDRCVSQYANLSTLRHLNFCHPRNSQVDAAGVNFPSLYVGRAGSIFTLHTEVSIWSCLVLFAAAMLGTALT